MNKNFKVLYCSKWIKNSKSCHDLDLGPTMPNIELVEVIFMYYNVFEFQVLDRFLFELSCKKHTCTETLTHTYGRTQRLTSTL